MTEVGERIPHAAPAPASQLARWVGKSGCVEALTMHSEYAFKKTPLRPSTDNIVSSLVEQGGGGNLGKKGDTKGGGKGKSGGNPRSSDGRFKFDNDKVPLCWDWNHAADGCCEPCPKRFSHSCEFCLAKQKHRSIDCSRKPRGWVPPQR